MEFNHLLRGADTLAVTKSMPSLKQIEGLTKEQMEGLSNLSMLPAFSNCHPIVSGSKEFIGWLHDAHPEKNVPVVWETKQPLCKIFFVFSYCISQFGSFPLF